MIHPALLAGFAGAVVILALIPGPNVALIVANSLAHGRRYGLLTVAGTLTAMVPQLLVAGIGLTAALGVFGAWFALLRWVGVAYLVVLGIRQWRAPAVDLAKTGAEPRAPRLIFARALLVSATNPKTLFFFSAFLPQFVSADAPAGPQLAVLSVLFLVTAGTVDSGWALAADAARGLLVSRGRLRNKVAGGALVAAGAALAAARVR